MSITPVDEETAYNARSLVRMLDGTLTRVVGVFEQAGITLPTRRYWSLGQPAWDCEQVVVSLVQAYIGPPGDEASTPQRCDGVKSAAISVQVVRCIPTVGPSRGKPPTDLQLQEAAEQLAIDAYVLLDAAADLDQWAPGYPSLGVIATVDMNDAMGGFQAVTLNVTSAIP